MIPSSTVIFIYAAVVAAGGLFGYYKAGSLPSLFMGLLFGFLLTLSALLLRSGSKIGNYSAYSLALLLTFFFGYRLFITKAFMPAGLMALISLAVVIFLSAKQR